MLGDDIIVRRTCGRETSGERPVPTSFMGSNSDLRMLFGRYHFLDFQAFLLVRAISFFPPGAIIQQRWKITIMLNCVILYLKGQTAFSISEVYTLEPPAVRETLQPYLCFYVSCCWPVVNPKTTFIQKIFSQKN